MEFVATKIMQIGEKYKCPIIDLSRTLDPFNRNHYGSTSIEPSQESGQFIVDLIIKILSVWDWNDTKNNVKSKIFYGIKKTDKDDKKTEEISTIDNDKSYRQSYFNILQARAHLLDTKTQNAKEMDLLADLFTEQDKQ